MDWAKYTDPIVELCLMPDKQKLLETTVPYYAIEGCKPPKQTMGRAGLWKKIAQAMKDVEQLKVVLNTKDDASTNVKAEDEDDLDLAVKAEEDSSTNVKLEEDDEPDVEKKRSRSRRSARTRQREAARRRIPTPPKWPNYENPMYGHS
jgi:hypothetical protein